MKGGAVRGMDWQSILGETGRGSHEGLSGSGTGDGTEYPLILVGKIADDRKRSGGGV